MYIHMYVYVYVYTHMLHIYIITIYIYIYIHMCICGLHVLFFCVTCSGTMAKVLAGRFGGSMSQRALRLRPWFGRFAISVHEHQGRPRTDPILYYTNIDYTIRLLLLYYTILNYTIILYLNIIITHKHEQYTTTILV